jgi:spermidine synthase
LANVPQGYGLIGFVSLVLLPPTILMGATLPVLAELLKPKLPLFNETVGRLYSVNALGSAMASLLTALLLFGVFGLKAVTALAAVCNAATAWMIWVGSKSWREGRACSTESARKENPPPLAGWTLGLPAIAWLAFLTGLVTLAQEVLLLKQAAWISGGRAETFGPGVGTFLLGLAGGSWKQIHTTRQELCPTAAFNWAMTTLAFSSLPFLSSYLAIPGLPILVVYLLLGICGYFGARTLPMVTGLLSREDQPKLGRIIAANIVGSVAGALLIGNALVDVVGLAYSIQIVAALSFLIGLLFVWASFSADSSLFYPARWLNKPALLPSMGLALLGLAISPLIADRWLERLLLVSVSPDRFVFVAESKSGIAAVHRENGSLVVYGGGVYDGAINTRLSPDTNGISRLYRLLGMHEAPKNVLEIGLSSGSWARVLALDERVKRLVSIEINPAYRRLVAAFPEVAPVLDDPKLELHIDDGRRWLNANRSAKFDLIVSNNSFYWRAGATLLTSQEFMALAKDALQTDGILLVNTTGSPNIVSTALAVFPHVAMIQNMLIASRSPLDLDPERAIARLARHPNVASTAVARQLLKAMPIRPITEAAPNTVVIEDDQMNEEFGNVPWR